MLLTYNVTYDLPEEVEVGQLLFTHQGAEGQLELHAFVHVQGHAVQVYVLEFCVQQVRLHIYVS